MLGKMRRLPVRPVRRGLVRYREPYNLYGLCHLSREVSPAWARLQRHPVVDRVHALHACVRVHPRPADGEAAPERLSALSKQHGLHHQGECGVQAMRELHRGRVLLCRGAGPGQVCDGAREAVHLHVPRCQGRSPDYAYAICVGQGSDAWAVLCGCELEWRGGHAPAVQPVCKLGHSFCRVHCESPCFFCWATLELGLRCAKGAALLSVVGALLLSGANPPKNKGGDVCARVLLQAPGWNLQRVPERGPIHTGWILCTLQLLVWVCAAGSGQFLLLFRPKPSAKAFGPCKGLRKN